MDQLHLKFINFWRGQRLWHCNEQIVWSLCAGGECISSHYHFCLMSCPQRFGQQPPSPLAGCTASRTTLPAVLGWAAQPQCNCVKIRDILGKSVEKIFSSWLLQCCLSQSFMLGSRGKITAALGLFILVMQTWLFSTRPSLCHHLFPTDSRLFNLATFSSPQAGAGTGDTSYAHTY